MTAQDIYDAIVESTTQTAVIRSYDGSTEQKGIICQLCGAVVLEKLFLSNHLQMHLDIEGCPAGSRDTVTRPHPTPRGRPANPYRY